MNITVNPVPPTSGPVAAYSFDEGQGATLTDKTNNGHNGAITGASWDNGGHSGRALSFDGNDDMVTIADHSHFDMTSSFTIESWVKPRTLSGYRMIVLKERPPSGLAYGLYASDLSGPKPSASTPSGGATSPTNIAAGSWTHLATTYSGGTLRLFINGTQVASSSAFAPPSTSGALRIGGNAVWTFETFDGLIDDVRIYDRALSPTEIQADRDTPVAAPPPNNQDPTVSLTSPANGASLQAPASISYSADAADADGTVAKVEFFRGSTWSAPIRTRPTRHLRSGVGAGNYTLKARATDNSGAAVDSSTRSITVTAPNNQNPTVSLTSPANGASLQAPASISYSADAADADGTVAKVEFFRGSTLVGTDTNAPFTASESGVGAGNYTLKARATDNSGAAVDSSTRSITVTPNNQDPTVSLTSPANGASLQAPASISYSADAADADGTVAKVEFFRGSTLVGTDTNAPYTASEIRRRGGQLHAQGTRDRQQRRGGRQLHAEHHRRHRTTRTRPSR